MPEGDSRVPISGRDGTQYNPSTRRVTTWIIDPVTGIGAWTDVDMQVLVLADKRGDLISNEDLLGNVLGELQEIRRLFEQLMLTLG